MAPERFPNFFSLPFEVRVQIYWLATPSRIVPVQENPEDRFEFEKKLFSKVLGRKLDPSCTQFSFKRRRTAQADSNATKDSQLTLESFTFSTSEPSHKDWEPSPQTPKMPANWLTSRPDLAYELMRQGHFFSRAPVPALLHTCSESRRELMRGGYQLAFRTRSSGPRTWFNFERDILHLAHENPRDPYNWLRGGAPWDVGHFDPAELRKVRRLVLSRSAPALDEQILYLPALWYKKTRYIIRVLQAFEQVSELFLGMWEQDDLVGRPQLPPATPGNALKDPLRFVAVDEVDALVLKSMGVSLVSSVPQVTPCPGCDVLDLYMNIKGDQGKFMAFLLHNMEICLRCERNRRPPRGSGRRLNVPKVRCCHVLRSSMADALDLGRLKLSKAAAEGRNVQRSRVDKALHNPGPSRRGIYKNCCLLKKKAPLPTSKFMGK